MNKCVASSLPDQLANYQEGFLFFLFLCVCVSLISSFIEFQGEDIDIDSETDLAELGIEQDDVLYLKMRKVRHEIAREPDLGWECGEMILK